MRQVAQSTPGNNNDLSGITGPYPASDSGKPTETGDGFSNDHHDLESGVCGDMHKLMDKKIYKIFPELVLNLLLVISLQPCVM